MHEYKFSVFKRPYLGNFFFDVADKSVVSINIFQCSDAAIPKCRFNSNMFENNDMTEFVKANARLKVKAFRFAFGAIAIDCY